MLWSGALSIVMEMLTGRSYRSLALALAALAAAGCSSRTTTAPKREEPKPPAAAAARDWDRYPAVAVRTTNAELVALGDVHGGYDRLVRLLEAGGLVARDNSPVGYRWTGGDRTLVCTGDLIDKGTQSLPVLDLMMALEADAPAAGGAVVVTLGNHEAEFLADPNNDKAVEFREELAARGIDPASLPRGQQPYGAWMMNRPVAAKVNDWFFSHAGNTSGETVDEIAADFRKAVDAGRWGAKSLVGDDSILEAREWWKGGKAKDLLDDYLSALGARHIVFGHDPSAFGDKGRIEAEKEGRLVLIDVGMSPAIDYSEGALLVISSSGGATVATSLGPDGERREVWSSRGP